MAVATKEAPRRLGERTFRFPAEPRIVATGSIAGRMEAEGPLGAEFDETVSDSLLGQASWERAERELMRRAVEHAVRKAGWTLGDVDFMFGGDLLNQIVSTSFAARDLDIPAFGLFSACATLTAALTLAAMAVDGGYARRALAAVSSHHDTAERQYRFPTEFGNQRPPTAQWTATAGAAFLLAAEGEGPRITMATPGRVVDYGLKDPFDMGSAMAPAAADTIAAHLRDTGRDPSDYDMVLTGDLAAVGTPLVRELLAQRGYDIEDVHEDCGLLLYDRERQDVHAGGSGAACSGATVAAHIWKRLAQGDLRRVLLVATGALHSPTTYQQGETIPCVAHAVVLEAPRAAGG
ncbi:MAG: stage V sporulation protein AD [Firmicutes bacterium]|nr:stage V sporulation protein AD [Bacillota bacterium]